MVLANFFLLVPLFVVPISSGISNSGNSNSAINNGLGASGNIANTNGPSENIGTNVGVGAVDNDKLNNFGSIGSDTVHLSSRVVHTKYGSVSGTIVHLEGRHLDPVEVFKGIPYASPPIGSLRFMPPVTGALWSGVRKADR